jgi:hypothetical protein
MTDLAIIYRITDLEGRPVTVHDGETMPRHAEMLCQDLAFCDPTEVSKVLFPVFSGESGRTSPKITRNRWKSFGLLVERYDRDFVRPGTWTTYRHLGEGRLTLVTLDEWLTQHSGDRGRHVAVTVPLVRRRLIIMSES